MTYGGDGTILRAEHLFPGVPKIPIKRSHTCNMCIDGLDSIDFIRKSLLEKKYSIKEFEKVEAVFGRKKLVALNDIQVHNKDPRKALRFSMESGNMVFENLIGDGLVFSTAYGSTGYYSALGNRKFEEGAMIGFNNVHNSGQKSIELVSEAKVKILRETCLLIADNQGGMLEVKPGKEIVVRKSKEKARFVVMNRI